MSIPDDYYSKLATIESGNNPNAKSPTSSASGLYQFVKSTFQKLGYDWSQVFDPAVQQEAIEKLTTQNANALGGAGIAVNDASLYAAHFFGVGTAEKVLGAADGTEVSSLVSSGVINANSFLKGMTVADFKNWLTKKTGTTMSSDSTLGNIASSVGSAANAVGGALSSATSGAASAVSGVTGGFVTWIENLFSFTTAARFSAVFIGIILITIALAAFVLTSNSGQQVVKVAAVAA